MLIIGDRVDMLFTNEIDILISIYIDEIMKKDQSKYYRVCFVYYLSNTAYPLKFENLLLDSSISSTNKVDAPELNMKVNIIIYIFIYIRSASPVYILEFLITTSPRKYPWMLLVNTKPEPNDSTSIRSDSHSDSFPMRSLKPLFSFSNELYNLKKSRAPGRVYFNSIS